MSGSNGYEVFSQFIHENDVNYYLNQVYLVDETGNQMKVSDIPGISTLSIYEVVCEVAGLGFSAWVKNTSCWDYLGSPALSAFGDVYFNGEPVWQAVLSSGVGSALGASTTKNLQAPLEAALTKAGYPNPYGAALLLSAAAGMSALSKVLNPLER